MRVQVNPQDRFTLTEALSQHLDKELGIIEKRFGDRLTTLEVYLSDLNGPKGGVDKECKLEARPRGLEPVVVDNVDADAYLAIKGAVSKLVKAMEHRLGRLNSRP